MTRLTSIAAKLATITATLVGLSASALAQQAEIAARLNEEGKELMFDGKFAEATAKFRDASARSNEPGHFFNLCTSLFQEGKFSEAMTACNAASNNNPAPELQGKVDKLVGKIEEEAKKQGVPLVATGGGGGDPNQPPPDPNDPNTPPPDPNNPNPNPNAQQPQQYAPAVGRPPEQGVFTGTSSDNKYTWTLGIDLFGGGGRVGQPDYYGTSSGGFRIKGDYLLNPATRIGAQGYFQLSHFGKGEGDFALVDTLDIFDVGVAAYKHMCPRSSPRLCLTPLAGIQLALMSPAGEESGTGEQVFNYAALGGRLEVGLQYGLGARMEHVIGVQLGVNIYSAVFSGPEDFSMLTAEQAGLDKGGAAAYFGFGYTYRFNTPLGSSPFVTLE